MSSSSPQNWPDLAIGLYDRLTARKAEITYQMDDLALSIPSGTGAERDSARWVLNGTLRIHTRDGAGV